MGGSEREKERAANRDHLGSGFCAALAGRRTLDVYAVASGAGSARARSARVELALYLNRSAQSGCIGLSDASGWHYKDTHRSRLID